MTVFFSGVKLHNSCQYGIGLAEDDVDFVHC